MWRKRWTYALSLAPSPCPIALPLSPLPLRSPPLPLTLDPLLTLLYACIMKQEESIRLHTEGMTAIRESYVQKEVHILNLTSSAKPTQKIGPLTPTLPPWPFPLPSSMSSLCCHWKRKESRKHTAAIGTLTSAFLLKEVLFIVRVVLRVIGLLPDSEIDMQREDRSYALFITVSRLVVVDSNRNQVLLVILYTTSLDTVISNA